MTATLALTKQLIACPSETPQDADCQHIIGQRLAALGFELETLVSGPDHFPSPIYGQNGLQPNQNKRKQLHH